MTALEEYYKLKNMLKLTDEEEKIFKKKREISMKGLTRTEYKIFLLISKGEEKNKILKEIGISKSHFYVCASKIYNKLFGKMSICSTAIDFLYEKAPEIVKHGGYYVQ